MHQFNEYHPEFRGFSAFYEAEILPGLKRDELSRLDAISKIKKNLIGIAVVTLAALALFIYQSRPFVTYIFILAIGGIGAAGSAKYVMRDVRSGTKENIVGNVCRFLGLEFQSEVFASPRLSQFIGLGLLTHSYDRSKFEDQISGLAHGARFLIHEAHLEKREGTGKNRKWVTKFRGQLMFIQFDQKFFGRTVVLRDKGWLQGKKKGDMKRVGLVDPVFEDIFEAYGTDQVEARYLLTPTFMQRLVDLEHSVDGGNIRFGFDDGHLFIAVETGNRYEPGSMFEPLTETQRTQKILDEIGAIYDVIDGVMKRPARRSPYPGNMT